MNNEKFRKTICGFDNTYIFDSMLIVKNVIKDVMN